MLDQGSPNMFVRIQNSGDERDNQERVSRKRKLGALLGTAGTKTQFEGRNPQLNQPEGVAVRAVMPRVAMTITRAVATATVLFLVVGHVSAKFEGPLVFILAGQSNMVGQGLTAGLKPGQAVTPANVTYFLGKDEVGFFERERFGLEVSLAQRLAEVWPDRELIFVKYALGGTSLLAWAPRWDVTRAQITGNAEAGPMYAKLIDILDSLGLRQTGEIGAVFWMQGERDALFEGPADEYFENLEMLIAALRRNLADANLSFLLGLANPLPARYLDLEAVQSAQRRAANDIPAVRLVETAGLTKHADGVHYDTAGVLELGRRFADAFLATRPAS